MEHNMLKNVWPTVAPLVSCTKVVMLCPADLVFRGWISLGTSQPKGPHPHPKDAMKTHTFSKHTHSWWGASYHQ